MTPAHAPEVVAITGGSVVPGPSAPIENGRVLIQNGVITAVGAEVRVPHDAVTMHAGAQVGTAGLHRIPPACRHPRGVERASRKRHQ